MVNLVQPLLPNAIHYPSREENSILSEEILNKLYKNMIYNPVYCGYAFNTQVYYTTVLTCKEFISKSIARNILRDNESHANIWRKNIINQNPLFFFGTFRHSHTPYMVKFLNFMHMFEMMNELPITQFYTTCPYFNQKLDKRKLTKYLGILKLSIFWYMSADRLSVSATVFKFAHYEKRWRKCVGSKIQDTDYQHLIKYYNMPNKLNVLLKQYNDWKALNNKAKEQQLVGMATRTLQMPSSNIGMFDKKIESFR